MKKEFISLSGLKKVLSPKELENITGGSTCVITCGDGTYRANTCEGAETFWCAGTTIEQCCCG